ncbi:hypothetical protein PROFUN_16159 [Planoprotostelium fungivorum]|uniref:Uncharacterized protein n=1 Tax=Planoprotostelium fungivorum TaxID=1890364 RepID=A0A2P6MS84_9EUKA|nr:hypothetical protein PROFUN_16159 [Planoprotostelium fungivorum]
MTTRAGTKFASGAGGKEPNQPVIDSSLDHTDLTFYSDDEDPKFVIKERIHQIITNSGWPSRRKGLARDWMFAASEREKVSRRRQARKDDLRLLVLAATQEKWPEHALCRLGGNQCTLKDSSLCLIEAEANKDQNIGKRYLQTTHNFVINKPFKASLSKKESGTILSLFLLQDSPPTLQLNALEDHLVVISFSLKHKTTFASQATLFIL